MEGRKRKASGGDRRDDTAKKVKGKKQWSIPRRAVPEARAILPGDTGIWATCAMKKEAKSVVDLKGLFQEYTDTIYGAHDDISESEAADIEDEINKELAEIRKPESKPLLTSVKLDTQCLVFFKTREPINPVKFVEKICEDAAAGVKQHNCRFVKRLTPMTSFEKANQKGLEALAKKVLEPHFHLPDQRGIKFAIRPTFRNNKEFSRDGVIKTVAAAVGPSHQVNLKNYDLLILVEIYQNVVGMSVVGANFDKLKRFNLEELCQAAPSASTEAGGTNYVKSTEDQ